MRILCSAVLVFLACSGGNKSDNVIRFWQFWSDMNTKPVIEQIAAEFEAENPGVKIEITDLTWANGHDKLVISFAANDPPDIMELGSDWVAEFSSNGLLAELESDLPENYLYPAVWENKLYGLPWLLDSRLLYFNLDLLEKAGAEFPSSWAELESACEKINRLDADLFGFGCNSAEKHRLYKKYLPFLWSNGGRILNDEGNESELDSREAIEALEYYLGLCDCGVIESQRRLEEYFREGKIGFVISGGWLLRRLRANPPEFKYRLATFITPRGDTGRSFFGGEYIAVHSKSDKIDLARKFAEFLTTKVNSQRLCDAAGFGFPPYLDLEISDPQKAIQARQLSYSMAAPPTPLWNDIEMDIEDALEAALYDHGTPEEIFKKMSETITEKLRSAGHANKK
ncbi:MAG: extracellular solute-binding protein [candidate division Zixibacteria bacterium]